MNLEQLDHYCDEFERRLKEGSGATAEDFARQCGRSDDARLLQELEKLSREYRESPPEAQRGVAAKDASVATHIMPSDSAQQRIGPYQLLQKIGEGGMGVVYMAEQSQPVSRRVAIKIVKPGMDSREVLARFEAERQALALMDHPNIARIFDAGMTEQGLPYFVMELVKGVPITAYCDERKLSTRERLDLFLPICHAVQHAHQKGVIHRDLKPSNVLIAQYDGRPVPKVIDFGLAKAFGQKLTEKTLFTQYGQIVGTIDYMSPEQAAFNQLDVDTRSDIYSLGVLLYELLAGETPFDKKRLRSAAFDELLRIIRQEEPPRPSHRLSSNASLPTIAANRQSEPKKLSHLLRGELDWVVMKAMDKDRDRRYQSANALADDVVRFLQHDAVLACPPSAVYRFQKFARRNRVLLVSAATVFAALLLGLAGTAWALVQASEQLRQKTAYIKRTYQVSKVQEFRSFQYISFEDAASRAAARLTAKLGREPSDSISPSEPLRTALLEEMAGFWDELIEIDLDLKGNPGSHTSYYRLQRAMCRARAGDHAAAYSEAQDLRHDSTLEIRSWEALVRTYALCAEAAENEPRLAEHYTEAAIDTLRHAVDLGGQAPSANDPELSSLRSHPDFLALITAWGDRSKTVQVGQNSDPPKVHFKAAAPGETNP